MVIRERRFFFFFFIIFRFSGGVWAELSTARDMGPLTTADPLKYTGEFVILFFLCQIEIEERNVSEIFKKAQNAHVSEKQETYFWG